MADAYLGEIRMFAGSYAPEGWALCDGSIKDIRGNEALFSLLGTMYGGNGSTTFALPDLRGRVNIGQGQGQNLSVRTMGQQGGASAVQVQAASFPTHTHAVFASNKAANTRTITIDATKAVGFPTTASDTSHIVTRYIAPGSGTEADLDPLTVTTAPGGSQTHSNLMPYLAINFIICTTGEYPVQQ